MRITLATIPKALVLAALAFSSAQARPYDLPPGFTEISSIGEFRAALTESAGKVRMKPGVYLVQDALPDNQTLFLASGSNNHFDLRGVTIQVDTAVLARLTAKKAHDLTTYRVTGSNNTFEGAIFEDIGEHPPSRSLADFTVTGDGNIFRDCRFIVRGSAPYGYGCLFGKGTERTYEGLLQKHAGLSVRGDNIQIIGCAFFIHTFGHAISMHGSQNTLIRDTTIEGELRPTDDLLKETSGPAFDLKFTDLRGRPIPAGYMLSLTEDGIRAYFDGDHDGKKRTGAITVINCTVKRMRGGITLALASKPAHVENCTVIESGWTGGAYDVPSGSIVKNCKGDAAYSPLLNQCRSNKNDTTIALELIASTEYRGAHPLAIINGSGHRVTLTTSAPPLPPACDILVGAATTLGTLSEDEGNDDPSSASNVQLTNTTRQPVTLTDTSSHCTVASQGPVTNQGTANQITPLAK